MSQERKKKEDNEVAREKQNATGRWHKFSTVSYEPRCTASCLLARRKNFEDDKGEPPLLSTLEDLCRLTGRYPQLL